MTHDEEYKGCRIRVETFAVARGYGWRYTIDDILYGEEREHPLSAEKLMLEEGKVAARELVDALSS